MEKVLFKIRRQESTNSYWEEFILKLDKEDTVTKALNLIRKNPVNHRGELVSPVVFESDCLEESCGVCALVINGHLAPACETFVGDLGKTITLEPLPHFTVLRDLLVDKSRIFEDYASIKDWVPWDGWETGKLPAPLSEDNLMLAQKLTACTHCGACLSACPRYDAKIPGFVGASVATRAYLTHLHGDRTNLHKERLDILSDGIIACDNIQNCQKACPQDIPLIEMWGKVKRATTKHFFTRLFT